MDHAIGWENEILMSRADSEGAAAQICAEMTDAQLIGLVLTGDEIAFENIFERYKRLVASVAARYFRRGEEIEEIIQISFTKVYLELGNFNGNHEFSLAGWIGRIAANACLDILRKQKRKPENLHCELSDEENEFLFTEAENGDRTAENSHITRDLAEKLLSRLPAKDRAVLQMLEVEEMSIKEIAALTGWSQSKVKIRAFRSRKALRRILKEYL